MMTIDWKLRLLINQGIVGPLFFQAVSKRLLCKIKEFL